MSTVTETVASLRADMMMAAASASREGRVILSEFAERLFNRLEHEDENTRATVMNIAGPILDAIAVEQGTEV